jgi:hypothetical protein
VDVYVRDLTAGTTSLISYNRGNTRSANKYSGSSVLTSDGRHVAFTSGATNLGPRDTNRVNDTFERDLRTGVTTTVSSTATGTTGNGDSYDATPSADGSRVVFLSTARTWASTRVTAATTCSSAACAAAEPIVVAGRPGLRKPVAGVSGTAVPSRAIEFARSRPVQRARRAGGDQVRARLAELETSAAD